MFSERKSRLSSPLSLDSFVYPVFCVPHPNIRVQSLVHTHLSARHCCPLVCRAGAAGSGQPFWPVGSSCPQWSSQLQLSCHASAMAPAALGPSLGSHEKRFSGTGQKLSG